jgi:diguanylate cyclase (GGDEF)-like protein
MAIKVFIYDRSVKGRSVQIKGDSASIGRGPSNDIQIDGPSVSKRHACIFKERSGYSIEDLRSQNGTWINGGLIAGGTKAAVESGVPISIGDVLVSIDKVLPPEFSSTPFFINVVGSATGLDEKTMLNDTLMTNRRRLQEVFEISRVLVQSLDMKEVCERILVSLFLHFKKLEAGAILLRDERSGRLRPVASKIRDSRGDRGFRICRSIVSKAIGQSRAVMITDTSGDQGARLAKDVEGSRIVSAMCVPLVTKGGMRGVIYVYSDRLPQGFKNEDLLFVTSISNPAAVAIENALLHEKSKQSQEDLRKSRNELEVKVRERTAELAEANAKLSKLSLTDDLTGLFNHRYLVRALETEFLRAVRYKRNLSVLLFDIDDFKEVNDLHGHSCGDAVLVKTASLIRGCLRSSDTAARYGGDEIAVLLPETDKAKAEEVAEKLRSLVEKTAFVWDGRTLNITCSIGIASVPDSGIRDWNALLDRADKALYKGKGKGKNVVFTFTGDRRQTSDGHRPTART